MAMRSVQDLFEHELKDIYDAEHQITKALPKMAKAAQSPELRAAFEQHLEETKQQIERLERVFELCNIKKGRKTCKGMQGLIEEGTETMEEGGENIVKDAALIGAAQRVEHYEIAGYGVLRTLAQEMGQREAAQLLQQTLDEEKATDEKLNMVASKVNKEAMANSRQ